MKINWFISLLFGLIFAALAWLADRWFGAPNTLLKVLFVCVTSGIVFQLLMTSNERWNKRK